MKKIVMLCLVAFLLCKFVMPASAAEISTEEKGSAEIMSSREFRMELACDVFPEYAKSIMGQKNLVIQSAGGNEIVVSETRKISDDLTITYQEHADGSAYVIYTHYVYTNSSSYGTGYSQHNISISVDSILSGDGMYIDGIDYTFVQNGYDVINNVGSCSNNSANTILRSYKLQENANGSAFVQYQGTFSPSDGSTIITPMVALLNVYVGDDQMSVSIQSL